MKKPMNTPQEVVTEVKTSVSIGEKIMLVVMMLGSISTAIAFAAALLPYGSGEQATVTAVDDAWSTFTTKYGSEWVVEVSGETGFITALAGNTIPVDQIVPTATAVNEASVDSVSKTFLADSQGVFGIAPDSLEVSRMKENEPTEGATVSSTVVSYDQTYQSLPVVGADVTVGYFGDELAIVRSSYLPIDNVPTEAQVLGEDAELMASSLESSGDYASFEISTTPDLPPPDSSPVVEQPSSEPVSPDVVTVKNSTLVVFSPDGTASSARLAWKVELERTDKPSLPVYYIDALDGSILDREESVIEGNITGTVTARIYPNTSGDSPTIVNVKNNTVTVGGTAFTTDASGYYSATASGTVSLVSKLEGPFTTVYKSGVSDLTHTATVTNPSTHSWNWKDTDSSDYERSNIFYHDNVAHDFFSKGAPFTYSYPVTSTVDVPGCSSGIAAYASGRNTYFCDSNDYPRHRSVIFHEYAHTVVGEIYSSLPIEMNEAFAFYWSASMRNNPVDTINGISVDNTARHPIFQNINQWMDGIAFAGALWDVRQSLGQTLADDLFIRTMELEGDSFHNFLYDILVVDQSLHSGTNKPAICDAFVVDHGIYIPECYGLTSKPIADISSPFDVVVGPSPQIQIVGTARKAQSATFTNYSVDHRDGFYTDSSTASWSASGVTLTSSTTEVNGGVLATLDPSTLTDGYNIIRLRVQDSRGTTYGYTRVYYSSSLHTGWPVNTGLYQWHEGSPAFVDLTGDGIKEVVYDSESKLYVRYQDGSLFWEKNFSGVNWITPAIGDINLDGQPEVIGFNGATVYAWDRNGTQLWSQNVAASSFTIPVIADVDPTSTGQEVIIVGGHLGADTNLHNYIFSKTGSVLANWLVPQGGSIPFHLPHASPAVGDIDGNPQNGLEIVATMYSGGQTKVFVWDEDGNSVYTEKSFPGLGKSSPVIADLNGDGVNEVIQAISDITSGNGSNDSKVYVWNRNGNYTGWPVTLPSESYSITSTPAVADVDPTANNGKEIFVGTLNNYVFFWRKEGTQITAPRNAYGSVYASPVLIDLDNDNDLEILVGSHGDLLSAWHHSGSDVADFPKYTLGNVYGSVAAADIDNDGKLEVGVGASDGNFYVWDIVTGYRTDLLRWPTAGHDNSRAGNAVYAVCSDGTATGICSANKPSFCQDSGGSAPSLVNNCSLCGCPGGTSCNASTGQCVACGCGSRICGTDACGTVCGTCPSGTTCVSDGTGCLTNLPSPFRWPPCFLAGTSISLAYGGTKPIEQIAVGDEVLSFDEKSQTFQKSIVKELFVHETDHYLIINNSLEVTPNHAVYSEGKWVPIGDLSVGDKIHSAEEEAFTITSIEKVEAPVTVYNFEAYPYHTYIADDIVAHNYYYKPKPRQ